MFIFSFTVSIKLILSTIYEKIIDIENNNITMNDINRFITLGPKNYDFEESNIKKALETIKRYRLSPTSGNQP